MTSAHNTLDDSHRSVRSSVNFATPREPRHSFLRHARRISAGRGSVSNLSQADLDATIELPQYQLHDAIERIGPGPYQLVVLLLGGGVYLAEGSLLLMLSIIAKSLIIRWDLDVVYAGAIASFIFIGLLIGTIAGGFFCDRHGRRLPIMMTYLGISIFTCGGYLSPNMVFLISVQFMLGLALGFGLPAANAIICESCPSTHRSNVYCMTMVMFSLGQLYSATVIWIHSPSINHAELDWRMMLMCASVPPILLMFCAYFFLLESPHWLLATGLLSQAKEVVKTMASYTDVEKRDGFSIEAVAWNVKTPTQKQRNPSTASLGAIIIWQDDDDEGNHSWTQALALKVAEFVEGTKQDMQRFQKLFSPEFYQTTILMAYIGFVSNFSYYAMIYGLPDTLKKEMEADGENSWSPAAGLFFSAIFEIPGVFIAVVLGMTVTRKMNMTIAFMGTAMALVWVCTMLFVTGGLDHRGLIAVFAVKLFIASLFIVVYLYLLECYPTKIRATGLAFCMVIGRLGAFLCPFLYDGLTALGLPPVWFFVSMLALVSVAAVVSMLLPYETKDELLVEDSPPLLSKEGTPTPGTPLKSEDDAGEQAPAEKKGGTKAAASKGYSTMSKAFESVP